jgi:hypothetical protein
MAFLTIWFLYPFRTVNFEDSPARVLAHPLGSSKASKLGAKQDLAVVPHGQ